MTRILVSLSLISLVFVGVAQSASAQESGGPRERGNRFNFAPNRWKVDTGNMPAMPAEPVHAVRSGAVPRNMFGLDPGMLATRPAPMPMPVARPVTTSVTPQVFVPKTSFNPAFGKPTQPVQPLTAQPALPLAPMPMQAMAKPPIQAKPAAASHPVALRRNTATAIRWNARKPSIATAPIKASPEVASYGNKFYSPGAPLSSNNIGSLSSQTSLNGRIISRGKKSK
jgi:hypothetical protein